MKGTLTLLYYAGYLTTTVHCFHTMIISILISVKPTGWFKVPNREVMVDWARWITGSDDSYTDILDICVEGHISTFAERWPNFMQQHLNWKMVGKVRGVISLKTPERIYQVYFLGLMHVLRPKGREVSIEPRAGGGYLDIHIVSRKRDSAVLIELKSSNKPEHIERGMLVRRSSRLLTRTIEIQKVFWTFAFFENMASLAITWPHVLKVDIWSLMLRVGG